MTGQQRLSLLAGASQMNGSLSEDRGPFVRDVSRNEP